MRKYSEFVAALVAAVAWVALAKVGCLCDRETRRAWEAGEPFDRADRAIRRLALEWRRT
jgi:hypothetical protein